MPLSKIICWSCGLAIAALLFGCSARPDQRTEPKPARKSTPKEVSWVMDETADTPRSNSPLRVRIRMEQPVWGDWETARFDYWIESSSDGALRFRDGDKGRGFAGKLLRLRNSQGDVHSWGDEYVDPKKFPPAFGPVVQASRRGETVSELRGIAVKEFLGQLKAGKYTLQVLVPSGRLSVNDTPTLQLASGLLTFRVVVLTDAMRKAIGATPQDSAGVVLTPQAQGAKAGVNDQEVDLKLTNGSRIPIEYSGYFDDPTSALYRWEVFTGDGTWREKGSPGWCGTGLVTKRLGPGESAKITADGSESPSRIVRFRIPVTDAGTKQFRDIVSPGVELGAEKSP